MEGQGLLRDQSGQGSPALVLSPQHLGCDLFLLVAGGCYDALAAAEAWSPAGFKTGYGLSPGPEERGNTLSLSVEE